MPHSWHGTLIGIPSTARGIAAVLPDYEAMLLSILDAILQRFERNPGYRFVDTKLSILTGRDFAEAEDPERDFRGKGAIYLWIQGRGLEALAGHAAWIARGSFLPPARKETYRRRITAMTGAVMEQLEELRAKVKGPWPFVLTPQGRAFERGADGRRRYFTPDPGWSTTSDLFYGKGLFCAARLLQRDDKAKAALGLFRALIANIERGRCRSDQIAFSPANRRQPEPGKQTLTWRMIAILGFAILADASGEEEWLAGGERFIRQVVGHHINLGQWPDLAPYDLVEEINADGRPWRRRDGTVVCDPGHALEFIGLAAKFLVILRDQPSRTPSQDALLDRCRDVFPPTLLRIFGHGFNREVGGIYKTFDLAGRQPLDGDMPWWNLPETLRAAAELLVLCDPAEPWRDRLLRVIADCSNAFVRNFVNPRCHCMAFQTVNAHGRPIEAIPATPDADPGYHTGLSIIDFLACIRRLGMADGDAVPK